jgi:ATP-dependent helicase/nuclease subunit B
LSAVARARLEQLRLEMPPATTEIFERESREFLADVELFVEAECAPSPSKPIGFEVSFGRPLEDGNVEPLAREALVAIELGGGLTVRVAGRIDRIDQTGDEFEVLDYKTGGYWREDWTGTFKGGRRLQHALYGLAAVELLRAQHKDPKVTGSVYYFSSHKGRQERVRIPAPRPEDIRKVLGDLRQLIVDGTYTHAPSDKECTFCDYRAACRPSVQEQAGRKLQDTKLTAYGRLASHV